MKQFIAIAGILITAYAFPAHGQIAMHGKAKTTTTAHR